MITTFLGATLLNTKMAIEKKENIYYFINNNTNSNVKILHSTKIKTIIL